MGMFRRLRQIAFALLWSAPFAVSAEPPEAAPQFLPTPAQPTPGPATGLSDSAGLRATVFGTLPQAMAPLPAKVPLSEINIAFP